MLLTLNFQVFCTGENALNLQSQTRWHPNVHVASAADYSSHIPTTQKRFDWAATFLVTAVNHLNTRLTILLLEI